MVSGKPRSLVMGAVASKTWIAADNLKALTSALGCALPEQGSGKNGSRDQTRLRGITCPALVLGVSRRGAGCNGCWGADEAEPASR